MMSKWMSGPVMSYSLYDYVWRSSSLHSSVVPHISQHSCLFSCPVWSMKCVFTWMFTSREVLIWHDLSLKTCQGHCAAVESVIHDFYSHKLCHVRFISPDVRWSPELSQSKVTISQDESSSLWREAAPSSSGSTPCRWGWSRCCSGTPRWAARTSSCRTTSLPSTPGHRTCRGAHRCRGLWWRTSCRCASVASLSPSPCSPTLPAEIGHAHL